MQSSGTSTKSITPAHPSLLLELEASGQSRSLELNAANTVGLNLLGVPIKIYTLQEAISLVARWAREKAETRLVSFVNVHMLTEGFYHPPFHRQLCTMDLTFADGMPLVWLGKLSGKRISRVCGPEFFEEFFATTAGDGLRHFFYGGNEGVAERVAAEFTCRYPGLQVVGCATPPFRPLTQDEDSSAIATINASRADVVWVSLGCPKQEAWLAEHRDKLRPSVLIAVGMAFDIIAGDRKRAPEVLCRAGLEWLYRFTKEPGRLGLRYLKSNLTFLVLVFVGMLKGFFLAESNQEKAA